MGYCRMLEVYLAGSAEGTNTSANTLTEFELKVIEYMSRRIDDWIESFREALTKVQNCLDWNSELWLGQEAAFQTLTNMMALISQFDADNECVKTRLLVVQQAYMCLDIAQVRLFFSDCFGTQAGLKLWKKLTFIARPLVDCRLLRSIAAREPHLGNCKVSLISSKSSTALEGKDVVDIFEAWEQLGLGCIPKPVIRKLHPLSQKFKIACAKTFSLHAEIQLVVHYEDRCAPWPTLDYFGCSKKTCLLCETFLGALPSPIATRGRHGICYPAWAVPVSKSGTMQIAVKVLEQSLLARIEGILNGFIHPRHKSLVMQSDIVSDFSDLTLEEWQQKEQDRQRFKNEKTIQHTNMLISQGITPTTNPKHHPLDNFELEDCCVMCNKSPGIQCPQCRSTYYCSKDCERSDFASHDPLCKQFALQPDRPSPEHKRAIFFPVEEDKPCLIWIPCRRQYDEEDGIGWKKVDYNPYLGTDDPLKRTMRIEHNPVRDRNLGSGFTCFSPRKEGYCVSLLHRDAYLKDGSATNKSILASVRASRTATTPHEYRGPMIALRELHHEDFADMTLADFRHLMDYLISYRDTNIRESVPDLQHRATTASRGVKICCYGEVELHGSEHFVSVDFTRANKISLGSGSISPISVCLGMPIRFWKDPGTELRHHPPEWNNSNPNVAFMMMETECCKQEWGWAPSYWSCDIGNVWAVREDGRDLAVRDVDMMCHFMRHKLQVMFEDVMESGESSFNRQRVLDFITKDNMILHWEETHGN
ncbi:uncharacterized protein N7511_009925 [Penicillium nucicola]|uniref:uncharacterized protein n=1 Tax=Penicillium nucicola TaxID=1850975 RepID=UPI002544DE08|nr:uncharacterized protein N7511_009925 [Penicillium nucicola]KAJ5748229.1 hypothetical protein N7511_009925 [Penicillium nucicola]